MSTNASTILRASFLDLGVIQPNEALGPDMSQDGLRRLNNMLTGWQTQYGTVTAVVRRVFNLIDNQQTYTIGLGGNFNVPRPLTIPGAGLWLSGLADTQSVSGITRSGYTATVTSASHGFAVGDEAYIAGSAQILYNGLQTVQTVPSVNTFTFTVQGTPTTPATGTMTVQAVDGQPVEIPAPVITDAAYQYNRLKNLPNPQFTTVYYNPTGPFGTIVLWPKPSTDANQLVLYLQDVFTGFEDLTTGYDYPELPGYAEALQYNLNLRLATPYGAPLSDDLKTRARESLGLVKRANNKLADLPSDASLLTWNRRAGYNINSGTGG